MKSRLAVVSLLLAQAVSFVATVVAGPARASAPFDLAKGHHATIAGDAGKTAPVAPANAAQAPAVAAPQVTTAGAGAGLIIDATFDYSITSNPNAAAIEGTINQAIAHLEALYSDPIRISILFRYSRTAPNGTTMNSMAVAESYFVIYRIPWSTYINALLADAKTPNDRTANGNLPSSALSTNVASSSAGGRAVGLATQPAMYADGSVEAGGPYDGIVTLNSGTALQFTRPIASYNYDAQRAAEHEMDEILGLGSSIGQTTSDLRPQDLFSWSSAGMHSHSSSGSRYFSIDGGRTYIVGFNQHSGYDYGDWYSEPCPQANPYVQNAFGCVGQSSDLTDTSPEGVNLDVIGYDLANAAPVQVTVQANPSAAAFRVDGTTYYGAHTFSWPNGSSHTVATDSFVSGGDGTRYMFHDWSDGGQMSHTITPKSSGTYTANFYTQYYLTVSSGTGGSTPVQSAWHFRGDTLSITASPADGYTFAGWHGTGEGSYTGLDNPARITCNAPQTEAATFSSSITPTPTPSPTSTPTPAGSPAHLINISTRAEVRRDDNVLIGGFIIDGTAPKKVIVRALGPSLPFAGALADPTLELNYPDGTVVRNDNWKVDAQTGQSQQAAILASGIAPTNDNEAALVETLAPGAYTAAVQGAAGGAGLGLVEVYDLATAVQSQLANISSRAFVSSAANVMIAGIIVGPGGRDASKIVVRALGPSLPVTNGLQDPTLELHDSNGATIVANDNWQDDADAAELSADLLAPVDPRESAVARVLRPGAYTAVLAGKAGASGVALVEVYRLQ